MVYQKQFGYCIGMGSQPLYIGTYQWRS